MRTMAIRELTAPALRQAAEDNEVIGITNDRVLAGVLFPIGRHWVEQLVEQNLSRIVRNVRRGEQEVEAVLAAGDQADTPTASTAPRFTALEDLAHQGAPVRPAPEPEPLERIRRVHLREMSGKLLRDAAEQGEAIILTTDRVAAGVIFPVAQRWVTELVEQNLNRVLYNITIGEKELASDQYRVALDDLVNGDDPRHPRPGRSASIRR
jgi:antitoxin (DNA-binding transcriptional repressor) of toxin-antitoxin stability system